MKLVAPVVMALVLLAAPPASPASAAAKHTPSCAAKGSKTVESTRDVRVWTRAGTDAAGDDATSYWGCLRSTGRQVFLTRETGDDISGGTSLRNLVVAGRYVAWESISDSGCARYQQCPAGSDPDGRTSRVVAFDLRARKRIQGLTLADPATAFALTQRGGLAILAGGSLIGLEKGGLRVLDTGGIDPRTLRAEISVVSWVRDGVERFARLR